MGIGFRELLIILAIALLIFGAKKLRTIGSDLGSAVKGFKKAMNEGDEDESTKQLKQDKRPDAGFDSLLPIQVLQDHELVRLERPAKNPAHKLIYLVGGHSPSGALDSDVFATQTVPSRQVVCGNEGLAHLHHGRFLAGIHALGAIT